MFHILALAVDIYNSCKDQLNPVADDQVFYLKRCSVSENTIRFTVVGNMWYCPPSGNKANIISVFCTAVVFIIAHVEEKTSTIDIALKVNAISIEG